MACSGAIAAAGIALVLASAEPVRFATEAPFPPYSFVDAQGTITGLERDVADEVCRRANLTCEWQNVQFDRLIPGVMSGEFDVVLGGLAVTPDRMALVDFTLPYNKAEEVDQLYGKTGAPAPDQAQVGVQSGTIQEAHARDLGWQVTSYGTPAAVIAALKAGRVDLAFGSFDAEIAAEPTLFALYQEDVPDLGTAMAVCRGNTALLDPINAALQSMIDDGTIDEFTARWL